MYPWKRVFSWLMLRPALEPPVRPGSVEIEAGRMGRGETQEEEGQEWVEVEIIDYRLFTVAYLRDPHQKTSLG